MKRIDDGRDDDTFFVAKIPDDHTPAHDPKYVDATCRWLERRWIDVLIQLGDHVDHESVGRFAQDSPKKLADGTLLEEWEIAHKVRRRYLAAAKKRNPNCRDYWLEGNHEVRIRKLEDRMPMLAGFFDREYVARIEADGGKWVPTDSTGQMLRFEQRPKQDIVTTLRMPTEHSDAVYHGLSVTHGWRHNMYAAKATAELAPWPGIIAFGHTHTVQVHTADQWGLAKKVGISCGWGGLPYTDYLHGRPNRWEQAVVWTRLSRGKPGHYQYGIVRILDGEIVGEMHAR